MNRTEKTEKTERTDKMERDPVWEASIPSFPSSPPSPSFFLWLDEAPRPGWANMAIDETLLERAEGDGESWLRLYQWEPHCLSFGRHEPATRRYDVDRIKTLELDTVRRPTGGRAVWHGRELTYAVAAPSLRFGSLQAAYLEIHRMLGDALRGLGARVSLAPSGRTCSLDAGACFAYPAGGELLVAGRKVVGSAQYRSGAALLQHGSILIEDDQQTVLEVTRGASAGNPSGTSLLAAPLTALLGRPLRWSDIAEAISRAAALRWRTTWERISDPNHVLGAAAHHYPQYRSVAWTWAR